MPQGSPPLPVDGVTSPAPVPAPQALPPVSSSSVPKPRRSGKLTLVLMGFFAFLYVIPALVLLGLFPTPDGSLSNVKDLGTLLYAVGAGVLVLLLVVGLLRIVSIKEHPRMRFFALVRLAGFTVPLVALSGLTIWLINVPPKLRLEVTSPTNSADLTAPVSVSFGMETALKFFAQNNMKPLKFEWDFNNDGLTDQETFDPQSTYLITNAGIYNIVANVTMTSGEQRPVVYRLVVPRASFGLQPQNPIINEPATFTLEHLFARADAPKLLKAKWDFDGDGTVDLETDKLTAAFTYRKLGATNASVAMTLSNQSQTSLKRTIQVEKAPEQPFPITLETEPHMLLGPPPFGILFIIKTKEPLTIVTWDFGNQKSADGIRVAHVYASVGNFIVNVTARSESGAVARLSKVVRVTNPLEIRDLSFGGSPPVKNFTVEGEVPLTVNLTPVTAQPLISFSWDSRGAEEVLSTDKTFYAVYRDEGEYTVDLIGIDPDQNVFRKSITIKALAPKSLVSFSMDPTAPTAPALVKFDASDTFIPGNEEITGFEWDFGDGEGSNGSKLTGARVDHRFQKPGTYVVVLTVLTPSGKKYTGKQTLVVRAPLLDACFLASRRSGKAPLGVRFDASCSTGEFVSWTWNFGDGSQSDVQGPTHVFQQAGEFNVTFTAVTEDGAKSVKTTLISVSAS